MRANGTAPTHQAEADGSDDPADKNGWADKKIHNAGKERPLRRRVSFDLPDLREHVVQVFLRPVRPLGFFRRRSY